MSIDQDYITKYFERNEDYQRDSKTWEGWKDAPKSPRDNEKTWDEACRDDLFGDSPVVPFYGSVTMTFRDLSEIYRKKGLEKDAKRCAELSIYYEREHQMHQWDHLGQAYAHRAMAFGAAARSGARTGGNITELVDTEISVRQHLVHCEGSRRNKK